MIDAICWGMEISARANHKLTSSKHRIITDENCCLLQPTFTALIKCLPQSVHATVKTASSIFRKQLSITSVDRCTCWVIIFAMWCCCYVFQKYCLVLLQSANHTQTTSLLVGWPRPKTSKPQLITKKWKFLHCCGVKCPLTYVQSWTLVGSKCDRWSAAKRNNIIHNTHIHLWFVNNKWSI